MIGTTNKPSPTYGTTANGNQGAYANEFHDTRTDGFSATELRFGLFQLLLRRPFTQNSGTPITSFFEDFYFRVYVSPNTIDLQSVTSESTAAIFIWNAWPETSSTLTDIDNEDPGISLSIDAPYVFAPNQYEEVVLTATTQGAAEINSVITFDFSTEDEDPQVTVIGNRIVQFNVGAEVPVDETWSWSTATIVAIDGTEQTVSNSGAAPRVTNSFKVILDRIEDVRAFQANLLSGQGRLFVPEWQYGAELVVTPLVGTTTIEFDASRADVRPGEFALILDDDGSTELVQVVALTGTGAEIARPLSKSYDTPPMIIPGSAAVIGNGAINRMAMDYAAETEIEARLQRYRQTASRPNAASLVTIYDDMPILDKRPLSNSLNDEVFDQALIEFDNGFGILDTTTYNSFPRINGTRQYHVKRVEKPTEMDYFKEFAGLVKGSSKPFFMPSFRSDLVPSASYNFQNAPNLIVEGSDYASKIFNAQSFRFLKITSSTGTVIYRKVTAALTISGGFESQLTLDTNTPTDSEWASISKVEFMLPCRIADDTMNWTHDRTSSIVQIAFTTTDLEE